MARYKTGNSLQSIIIHRRANKEEEIISTTTKDVIFANEHPVFNIGNGNWTKSLIITLRDRLFGAIKTLLPICSIWRRRRLRPDTLAEHYCQNFRNRKKWMDARTPAKNFFQRGSLFRNSYRTAPEQNDADGRRIVTLWPTSELIRTTPSMSVGSPTNNWPISWQTAVANKPGRGRTRDRITATQFPSPLSNSSNESNPPAVAETNTSSEFICQPRNRF